MSGKIGDLFTRALIPITKNFAFRQLHRVPFDRAPSDFFERRVLMQEFPPKHVSASGITAAFRASLPDKLQTD
jgi:hypothetical protein